MTNEPTAEVPAQPGRVPGGRGGDGIDTSRPGGVTHAPGGPAPATVPTDAPSGTAAPGTTSPESAPQVPGPAPAEGSVAAGSPGVAPAPVAAGTTAVATEAGHRRRRWPVVVLVVALVAALGAAGYLYAVSAAYAERLVWTEDQARQLGTELATTRGELEGVRGEVEAVRAQLATAQERITALADEKARIGDDREAQAQLLDYQARVSEAAGAVASALERCVAGQGQLIEYLEDANRYDPAELAQFGSDVEALCRSASEANVALQTELADR